MSYFDHVRCPACGAHIDPDRLEVAGGAAACPHCAARIGIRDLFGLKAAFDEDDDDTMTIDDLVPGSGPAVDPRASVAPAPPRAVPGPRRPGAGVLGILEDLKKGR